jgi:hypothetical protein
LLANAQTSFFVVRQQNIISNYNYDKEIHVVCWQWFGQTNDVRSGEYSVGRTKETLFRKEADALGRNQGQGRAQL